MISHGIRCNCGSNDASISLKVVVFFDPSLQEAGVSWLSDITWLHTLWVLLESVFVSGNAEPETSVYVMATFGSFLFIILGVPKLKGHHARAKRVRQLTQDDVRRLAGT